MFARACVCARECSVLGHQEVLKERFLEVRTGIQTLRNRSPPKKQTFLNPFQKKRKRRELQLCESRIERRIKSESKVIGRSHARRRAAFFRTYKLWVGGTADTVSGVLSLGFFFLLRLSYLLLSVSLRSCPSSERHRETTTNNDDDDSCVFFFNLFTHVVW